MQFGRTNLLSLAILVLDSLAAVAAPLPATSEKPAWAGGEFHNPGVYCQIVNEQRYEWIPTQDVTFTIQPNGRVQIHAPQTKKSFNGANDCHRFIYDHLHKRLTAADEAALFGDGLQLPPGNYGFAIFWLNAKSYDEVFQRPWDLTCNPETYRANSTDVDYVNLSVVPLVRAAVAATVSRELTAPRELKLPDDLQRVSWLPHYQVLPYELKLPPDKGFGVTRVLWDIPLEEVYKKVTHIQYSYAALDSVPDNRKWKTKQALDNSGKLATVEWLIKNQSLDKDFITVAEMDENFGNHGVADHAARAQQVFAGIYQRMQTERGVTSPNQVRLYDDYFSALEGYDNSVSFLFNYDGPRLEAGLASEAKARQRIFNGKFEDCFYFSKGAYKYRNWLEGGYLDSYAHSPEGIRIYNEIYNYERKYMAAPDRRVLKFSWSNAEGVNSNMYRSGTKSRLHFENGDIIRQDVVAWPFHMMLDESFWGLLLGQDFVLWHSNVTLVQDPLTFRDSWASGAGKTQWQPTGGKIVDFDSRDPAQPQRYHSDQGQFPPNPHVGESGAFAGAWMVGQITAVSDRTSKTLEYAPFQYTVAGGSSQTGYFDSDNPHHGALGNAKLSRYGVANYGQANIIKTYEAKKPICLYAAGKDGSAAIYQNIYCGLTETNQVTIQTPAGARSFQVIGNTLHVILLD
ncbi:MAG TPA: hypothetical protein VFE24_04765 [Pirellulales bacterium]|nr:hypothetical protein [Pirellulales bacterium]